MTEGWGCGRSLGKAADMGGVGREASLVNLEAVDQGARSSGGREGRDVRFGQRREGVGGREGGV